MTSGIGISLLNRYLMVEDTKMINNFAKLASDYWRLLRSYKKLIEESSPENYNRLKSNFRYAELRLTSTLNEYNIKIISYEGKPYTPHLAVSVLNGDEFNDIDGLIINQMIEPTVMMDERIIKMGKAILSKKVSK